MKFQGVVDFQYILEEWAISEKYLMNVGLCDDKAYLLQMLLQKRSPLIASLINAKVVKAHKISITLNDLRKVKLLNQKDRNKDTTNIHQYTEDLFVAGDDLNPPFKAEKWNFIAVSREDGEYITLIDGLHRTGHWLSGASYLTDKELSSWPSLSGYLINTKKKLKVFEDAVK